MIAIVTNTCLKMIDIVVKSEWVKNEVVPALVYTVTNLAHFYYMVKEKVEGVLISVSPVYVEDAVEFCNNGVKHNIKEYILVKMKRDSWVDWNSVKEDDTEYVEVSISFFGKRKRLIINKDFGLNTLNHTNEVVYAYLVLQANGCSKNTDVTSLVKEFVNVPLENLDIKYLEPYMEEDPCDYDTIDIVISKLFDMDEVTINLK